ncbi:hypothetical protein [Mycetocola sp.]|uniref:hypothetical protein n=1 Tax=Mycetocola sp. TaxID=1871042 RepID=UPI0039896201
MSDSAATGGDPATVDAMAHQTVTNDAVADAPVYNTDNDSPLAAREAEVTEEQHLDDRHATGEHYVSDQHHAIAGEDDPLDDVYRDDTLEAAADDPELNAGRGVDNI